MRSVLGLLVVAVVACGPDPVRRAPPSQAQLGEEMGGDPTPPPPPPEPANNDGPEISRSVGEQGGIVIMWPRVAQAAGEPIDKDFAARIQAKLRALAEKAVPGAKIDQRPEPERVCPKPNGCKGAALGAIIRRRGNACAAVALISGAGPSPQRIVEWAGTLKADALTVPFRESPEPHVKVTDYASCEKIDLALNKHEDEVINAIRAAVPR